MLRLNFPFSRYTSGILLVIIGLSVAAFCGSLTKILVDDLSPLFISWLRFFGRFLCLLIIVKLRSGKETLWPERPFLQLLRGVMITLGGTCFIFGVQEINFANAIAILYVYPFFMVVLAALILKESVGITAWLGVLGGFGGVIFVMRPDLNALNYHALFILFSGLMAALQMLINRVLGMRSDPVLIAMWGSLIATVGLLPTLPFVWIHLTNSQLGIVIMLAGFTALSQTCIIAGMTRTPVGDAAPFTYTEIISAIVIGFLMFGTMPDKLSFIGMTLIISSGVFVARVRTPQSTDTNLRNN